MRILCSLALLLLFPYAYAAEEIKCEKIESLTFKKLSFDNHTYIYLSNSWNYAGNALIHDPSCKCYDRQKEEEKLEETKRMEFVKEMTKEKK